jgi:hypothetical protein
MICRLGGRDEMEYLIQTIVGVLIIFIGLILTIIYLNWLGKKVTIKERGI